MHRFISARATTLSFERPKDFDLQKYDNDSRFAYGEGEQIAVRFFRHCPASLKSVYPS